MAYVVIRYDLSGGEHIHGPYDSLDTTLMRQLEISRSLATAITKYAELEE